MMKSDFVKEYVDQHNIIFEKIRNALKTGTCVTCQKEQCNARKRYGVFYCAYCQDSYPEEYKSLSEIFYKNR